MLVDRLYPALSRHEIATAQGEAIQLRWESEMKQAADELQAILNAKSDDDGECVAHQKACAGSHYSIRYPGGQEPLLSITC